MGTIAMILSYAIHAVFVCAMSGAHFKQDFESSPTVMLFSIIDQLLTC